jgi:endonuclease G
MPRRRNPEDDVLNSLAAAFMRLDPRVQIAMIVLAAVVGVAFLLVQSHRQYPTANGNPNALLGNPSNATANPSDRSNFLMVKPYFVLSYNSDNGTPNWVSWRVTSADLGESPRKQFFDPDATLPGGFNVVVNRDYSGSGFDRGHMCPHSDRAANVEMSYATFVMTNVIPQAPNVNRKAWEQLEEYGRELVSRQHQRLYVTSGPAGRGGRGSKGMADTLAGGKVVVPAQCWKVIVAVPDTGGDDVSKINAGTRVITVMMPNDNDSVSYEWASFRTSAAEIESRTGLHFFTSLPADVSQALRQKVDVEAIPPPRPRYGGESSE